MEEPADYVLQPRETEPAVPSPEPASSPPDATPANHAPAMPNSIQILSRSGAVLHSSQAADIKAAIDAAMTSGADLSRADLIGANL